jgi:hypothetical protein
MIRRWFSRAAAVLAAVMLSGLPAVAAQVTSPIASCCCPAGHGHGAQCPMKKPASSTKKPCHDSPDSRGDDGAGCPTLGGPCAAPFAQNTPPPRVDDFTILQWAPLTRLPSTTIDVQVPALSGEVPPPPEIPPPERA